MSVTILIIDDDPAITKILSILLRRYIPDVNLIIANDCLTGVDAIRKLKTGRIIKRQILPDIVLIDARLPVIDGFQCCERFSDMGSPHIVIMTAILTPDLFPKAISAGAETVLKKSSGLKSIALAVAAMAEAIVAEKLQR